MRAVFTVEDETGKHPGASLEISVEPYGITGKVLLEFSGAPAGENSCTPVLLHRAVLEKSHARAIASAMLSAATEAK